MSWKPGQPAIIAVDFDGTCVTHEFPRVGRNVGAERVLKRLTNKGHKLILWTMRSGHQSTKAINQLADAIGWFAEHDIPLWGINANPEQHWSSSPKAFAHFYIDDMAVGCPLKCNAGERPHVDWDQIEDHLSFLLQ